MAVSSTPLLVRLLHVGCLRHNVERAKRSRDSKAQTWRIIVRAQRVAEAHVDTACGVLAGETAASACRVCERDPAADVGRAEA